MNEPQPLRILLIDDDESAFFITRELLREINGRTVELEWTGEADQGYELILRKEHEVYLVDYRLGADDGLDLLRRARSAGCRAPILILTGQTDEEIDQQALKAGASDYLAKDVYDVSRLEHAIRYALERHGLLRDLERERYLLHSLMESLPDHVYFKDRASRFVRISRAMANWFGLQDPSDAVGKTDADFFTEEHARQAREDEQQLMESGEPVISKEEKETWPAGRATWVSTNKMPLRDHDGNVVGTIGISRNITDEKLALNALKRSELLNRLIVATALDAFVAMDSSGFIVNWNPQAEKTFGWKFEEAVHQPVADLLVPERYRSTFQSRLQQYLETGDGEFLDDRLELAALHRSGKEFPVEVTIAPIEQEGAWLFSAFVHDISRRKQAEQELRESKEAAEQASRAKSDFLANMSHEIRTPMNAILGMTELVLDTDLAVTQREYLSIVQESGDSLLNLINDILDFSKIEAGRFELDSHAFHLRDSLGDTLKLLSVRADRVDLELACHIDTTVPPILVGDAVRLRQIVVNLVGNAIKFTEQGEVVLHVEVDQCDADSVVLHFAVTDTGIGIASEKLETVFDAFQQADTSTTRRYGGTGLGLTICSRLVGLMGGSIWAESRPGLGSTFHFTARFGLSADSEPTPQHPLRGIRVLVVNNHAPDRQMLSEMLRSWDMSVTCVASVNEGLDRLRSDRDTGSPATLVIGDRFELVAEIQSDTTLATSIILTLATADFSNDMQRATGQGAVRCLRQPVTPSRLCEAIVSTLGVNVSGPEEAPASGVTFNPDSVVLPPLQILLVEDSLVNQKLALGLLGRWGHSVTVAENGLEAVSQDSSSDFDLILMDIQMPEMDGLEATRQIRRREQEFLRSGKSKRHIPIIAMTAHAMQGDREACLEAGMDSYISKPVRSWQLLEEIAACFPDDVTVRPETGSSTSRPDAASDDSLTDLSWKIHWPSAIQVVNGDLEFLREIAQVFVEESTSNLTGLQTAVDSGDCTTAGRLAHMMKASFRTLGADSAHDLAFECEQSAQTGCMDSFDKLLPDLITASARVTAQLRRFIETGEIPS